MFAYNDLSKFEKKKKKNQHPLNQWLRLLSNLKVSENVKEIPQPHTAD